MTMTKSAKTAFEAYVGQVAKFSGICRDDERSSRTSPGAHATALFVSPRAASHGPVFEADRTYINAIHDEQLRKLPFILL